MDFACYVGAEFDSVTAAQKLLGIINHRGFRESVFDLNLDFLTNNGLSIFAQN